MAFGTNTFSDKFKEYGKRIANNIQTGMRDSMAPKPIAPTTPTPPVAPTIPQAPIQNPALQPPAPNNGLQSPGMITEAGKIYQQRVTDNLLKPSSVAVNAQNTADTNASRRNYQTQKQTQEMMAQSPFGAGSRQYQRALMEGQAGANSANLAEQNQANAVQRSESSLAMDRASGLEDTEFARAIGERGYQDQNASRYSALIQDTKGRQAYNRLVASGVNPSVALQQVLDESGTIKEGYRGMDNMQQLQSEAEGWIKATTGVDPKSPEGIELVRQRMIAVDKAQQEPLRDATKSRDIESIKEKQNLGEQLTPEEKDRMKSSGEWEKYTFDTIPKGKEAVANWLKSNPDAMFTLNGKEYEMVRGGDYIYDWDNSLFGAKAKKENVTTVRDVNGVEKYIYNGTVNDKPPVSETEPGIFSEW
jgi:hypothetical protein